MKAKGKKTRNTAAASNKHNDIKTISSNNFTLPNINTNCTQIKKRNISSNISKSVSQSINPTNILYLNNNLNTKNQNDKVSATPINNKLIKPFKDDNINNNIAKNKTDSTKNLNINYTRRDSKGNIIYKGSKMHHIDFNDCLENKKPLVEVIKVESFKKENQNEFLNEDYDESDDYSNTHSSNSCSIF